MPSVTNVTRGLLGQILLTAFVVEVLLRLYISRVAYLWDPWNCFDLLVIGAALLPGAAVFSVLRALRPIRMIRLTRGGPRPIPGVVTVTGMLVLVTYLAGVIATDLFRALAPQHFGHLGRSLWTLFQVTTGDNWAEIADAVMAERPAAWVFFLVYIVITTYVLLGLLLAVVVKGMAEFFSDQNAEASHAPEPAQTDPTSAHQDTALAQQLAALHDEVRTLRLLLDRDIPKPARAIDDLEST
ncbi:ion transporter [Micromonospora craterilacus]|uniref:ion transporter n=1 Tax=Micromonospora craterilacus TaxID=1655439 RepID=UPI0013142C80|nr:ion transporter [Micromonospora craterilacus]